MAPIAATAVAHRIPVLDLARTLAPEMVAIEKAALATIRSSRYVLGAAVQAFEGEFAAFCGVAEAVGVGNGTDALELALRALGVGVGDRVVCVANAGGYASTAIRACGALPHYVDVRGSDLLIDPDAFANALAHKPRAAIVTHLYGQLAAVDALLPAARAAGVPVIEDCAQAHGAARDGRAGSFGTLSAFSFYPTKNLGALGDAGAVVGNDRALIERVRALRQYGWTTRYRMGVAGGRNSRLDEIQAAILSVRLPHLDEQNARRRAIAARFAAQIRNPLLQVPARGGAHDVAHLFVLRCSRRAALIEHLDRFGVCSDVHYPVPDHRQIDAGADEAALPETERAAAEVLTLPCHPALDATEQARVIDACNRFDG